MSGRPLRLAYVASEYPKVSHTFIMREVEALRRLEALVDTFSVRRAPPEALLTAADRRADAETFAILPADVGRLLRAHARWALTRPRRYLGTLLLSFRVGPPGARNRLWQLFYFVEAVLLANELRRRRIEHVHAHFVNVACSLTLLATHLLGRPWSFTMHGSLEFDNVRLHGIPEKVRRATFVACISDFCRAQLMRLVEHEHWSKLHVVHCGVEPAVYRRDGADGRSTDHEAVEVVSVGRLDPMKGFDVLLEAVAELIGDGVALHLTLVGDGPERRRLQAAARRAGVGSAVSFTGALGAPDVASLLDRADVFCLPSFAEGVPVVLMEAMAAGLPVVATSVMGIPELVRDGESGLLVAPGRARPLADALRTLAHDASTRRAFGDAGRATVERSFDVDGSVRRLARLFAGGVPDEPAP